MGHQEIRFLPTRITTLWNLDRPQTTIRSIFKGSKRFRQSETDAIQKENYVLQFFCKVGPGKGTLHCRRAITGAVFSAAELDKDPRDIEDTIHCLRISNDPALNIITEAAKDNAYAKAAAELLQTGKQASPTESTPWHEYASVLSTLSISKPEKGTLLLMKDKAKIVIPKPARRKIIAELHRAHSGINKTYTTACKLYYWPHIQNDIEQAVAACSLCQADWPMQARPLASGTDPSSVARPMDEIGTDLLDAIGKKWLATVDRYSGYAWLTHLTGTHTAKITAELSQMFNYFGWPKSIRTDGRPCMDMICDNLLGLSLKIPDSSRL